MPRTHAPVHASIGCLCMLFLCTLLWSVAAPPLIAPPQPALHPLFLMLCAAVVFGCSCGLILTACPHPSTKPALS